MVALPGLRPGPARGGAPAPAAPGASPGARPGGPRIAERPDSAAERRKQRAAHEAELRALPRKRGVVRQRVSRLTIVSVALLAIAGVGLVQVLQTSQIATMGYGVRQLELERQSLDAQIRVLEANIASSTNLEHLKEQAVERLGMVPAEERLQVSVDVSAPQAVPLPRRYVPTEEYEPLSEPAWWEVLLGRLPGLP